MTRAVFDSDYTVGEIGTKTKVKKEIDNIVGSKIQTIKG
jgi:hypothetical protein